MWEAKFHNHTNRRQNYISILPHTQIWKYCIGINLKRQTEMREFLNTVSWPCRNIMIEFLYITSPWFYRSEAIGLGLVHLRIKQCCGTLNLDSPTQTIFWSKLSNNSSLNKTRH
jgi:hypothetical protein